VSAVPLAPSPASLLEDEELEEEESPAELEPAGSPGNGNDPAPDFGPVLGVGAPLLPSCAGTAGDGTDGESGGALDVSPGAPGRLSGVSPGKGNFSAGLAGGAAC